MCYTYQRQESLPQRTWAESDSAKGVQRNTVWEILVSRQKPVYLKELLNKPFTKNVRILTSTPKYSRII